MKKTIFRLTYAGLLMAAFLAFGAVTGVAQDPNCTDVAGQNAMQDEFDTLYKKGAADLVARQKAIDSGKAFLDKYGSCDTTKERSDWLRSKIPGFEKQVATAREAQARAAVVDPFNAALVATNTTDATAKSKAYSDAYATGQQVMAKYPDDYRTVEIVLATMGGDEALLRNNYKYSDDTLRYAKMALADLQANRSFAIAGQGQPQYGLSLGDPKTNKVIYNFSFKDQPAAAGWMNLYVGYILFNNKNDKAGALPYLYQAAKLIPSDAPVAFALVGDYYFDQLKPAITEINTLIASQNTVTDPDKLKALVQEIKDKVALSNGIAERAMDAYARAYMISTKPDYKTNMKNMVAQVFKVRYGTTAPVTVDQWISSAVAKPFPDPTTPVTPIADPEPVKTTTTGAEAPATTTTTPVKTPVTAPVKTQTPAKPSGAATTKKPGVATTKTFAKKRGA
ncbi:MAG: hypothetical protein ACJ73D_10995 [Pyrinomonadaceae bacterium]